MDGTPYGVLEIDSQTQHDYDEHDIDFLTGFANIVAEAVNTSHRRAEKEFTIRRMQDIIGDRERLIEFEERASGREVRIGPRTAASGPKQPSAHPFDAQQTDQVR